MISKNKLKELSVYKQQKRCEADAVFVVEGVKMCGEALAAKAPIKVVCATNLWLSQHPELPKNAEIHEVEDVALARLSHMPTPNEVWMLLDRQLPPAPRSDHGLTLALDHLQDPGNLGTIIRTADWFGVRRIVCSNHPPRHHPQPRRHCRVPQRRRGLCHPHGADAAKTVTPPPPPTASAVLFIPQKRKAVPLSN